jgi:hypothetical protein
MGLAKKKMMEQDDDWRAAISLLLEVGALEECENHEGTYFDGDGEKLQDPYKLANSRVSSRTSTFSKSLSADHRTMTNLIKSAYEDNSGNDSCSECEGHGR